MPVDGPLKKQNSVKTRRYVWNQCHAGLTGSICQPVTEFTYNWKRRRPLPPCLLQLCLLCWMCHNTPSPHMATMTHISGHTSPGSCGFLLSLP